jgi:tRNA G18 (ribose-2'-O)-methylase SpoU
LHSWNIQQVPSFHHFNTFEEAVYELRSQGKILIGTSGNATDSFYDRDYSGGNVVIVFGTESSGLTQKKQEMLDGIVKLPMSKALDFYTLPIVTSAIGFEMYRQIKGCGT